MFEPEVFRKQMYYIEKKVLVTLLGLFGAPIVISRLRNCAPLYSLVTPLFCYKCMSHIVIPL